MAYRLEITSKIVDMRAKVRQKYLFNLGFKNISRLWLVDVYTINKKLTIKQLTAVGELLGNPVTQTYQIILPDKKNKPVKKFDWALEIGFLPGVTDNVGSTAKEAIEDLFKQKFKPDEGIYFSQLMFIKGKLNKKTIKAVGIQLANPLIQKVHFKNYRQFIKDNGMDIIVPQVKLHKKPQTSLINLEVKDEELIKIGKLGIANPDRTRRGPLTLNLLYLKTIQKYFNKLNRKPTDIELESIAQTWSEHCKHTIFTDPMDEIKAGLFKTYIKAATQKIRKKKGKKDFCISVFTDNSGAIAFDDKYLITHKVETHNSPSALDPFGGAITGIVGVNRDTIGFGLGAKPIINTYGYCFANPQGKTILYKDKKQTQKMLDPKRIIEGVIQGVNIGGNCSGIPTPQGFAYFDPSYKGKPLVFVGTVGLIPKKVGRCKSHLKKAQPGDYVVMIGGQVGLDGIHGATFSSESLNTGSPATAVQIGDPITQKKLSDALIKEARDQNLYRSITDNGAGGLSCSVAEMAKESGGCKVQLNKVPLKYPGLDPWQIWISESQERMTLAVPKNKWLKLKKSMNKRGVEATIIGRFTNTGKCIAYHGKQKVMDLDMDFLHNGLPPRPMKTVWNPPKYSEPQLPKSQNLSSILLKLLKGLNIASLAFISQQYDHEVQGGSALKPLQGKSRINSLTTAVKPVFNSQKAVIISQGINPDYSQIDTYHMAACAIDTAIRNIVAQGANLQKIALIDNFCWCSSNEPERLGQLKRAAKACFDYATAYQTPFISGKDSMFNDFRGFDSNGKPIKISILPTLLISSIGVVDDFTKVISLEAKFPEDLIYILGETFEELGGSEYYRYLSFKKKQVYLGNNVPQVNASKNKKIYQKLYRCFQKNLIASSLSLGLGGLGIALCKKALGGMLGIEMFLKKLPGKFERDDLVLFSESQGRILITINPQNKTRFEKTMRGVTFAQIGKITQEKQIKIYGIKKNLIVNVGLNKALKAYQETFKNY